MLLTDIFIIISYLIRILLIYDYHLDSFEGIVINITHYDSYNKLIVKKGFIKVIVNDYDFLKIKIGDSVFVTGTNKEITTNRIEGLFNYQNHYFSQNIVSIIKAKSIEINSGFNVYYLRRYLYEYINKSFDDLSSSYMLGMILGDSSSISQDAMENIRINGISHLFAISGLHITLLISIMQKLLEKINLKDNFIEKIISLLLLIYLIITNFTVSIFRASLMYFISIINKHLKLSLTSLDIISIIFILFVIFNPYYMYSLSFILSFSASISIIILSQTLRVKNMRMNSFLELLFITFVLQIITLPIVININNSINLLSIITNGIFITLVSFIILPSTFLVLIIPFFKGIYQYLILAFNWLNNFFGSIFSINIVLPSFKTIEIIIYYILLIIVVMIWNKKDKNIGIIKNNNRIKKIIVITVFSLFLITYYQKANLNIDGNIYFLDIYEGDCTIIDLPFNQGVVMIDTGTSDCKEVLSFLKVKGIREIDYLVLTHEHDDHCGNSNNIINNFKVNKIITSAYNSNSYPNQVRLQVGDNFKINGYEFYILGPKRFDKNDENNNSLIVYTKIGDYNYLFLADVTKEIEEELINYQLDVDCVKVAHHGSNTSTSEVFYKSINPKYVFIETGRVKNFGFPHQEVINTLSDYQIYRTDINYTITVKFNNKRSIIKTLK